MIANVRIARELGYLYIPDNILIDLGNSPVSPRRGSAWSPPVQPGGADGALTRIAMDDHKQIKLEQGDTVILSSRFIPGNEKPFPT